MLSIIRLFVLTCFTLSFTHASIVKSKKRKASTFLRDTNNDLVPVQLANSDTTIQNIPQQQQLVPQRRNVNYELLRVLMHGGKFFQRIPLSRIFLKMVSTGYYSLFSNVFAGDHAIGLRFHCTQEMLSLRLTLSSFTEGHITVHLKFLKTTSRGTMQEMEHPNSTSTSLTDGTDLPLCRTRDMQNLIQRNVLVHLDVQMLIESVPHDIFISCPPREQEFLRETRTTRHIKKLIDNRRYERVKIISDTMTNEKLIECLYPAITTLGHYNALHGYLKQRDMLSNFLVHGNIEIVRKVIIEIEYYNYLDVCKRAGIVTAIETSIVEGRHERAIDLCGFADAKERKEPGRFMTPGIFIMHSFDRLVESEVSAPLKQFITLSGNEFSSKYSSAFGKFCELLVSHLGSYHRDPGARKSLIDLIGQPSILTPVAVVKGFLCFGTIKNCPLFVQCGWKEVIQECLRKEYGGKELLKAIKDKFPDQSFGEYPLSAEMLVKILEQFPTKQQLEENWCKENAPIIRQKLEHLNLDIFPKVLWGIIAEYMVTWIGID